MKKLEKKIEEIFFDQSKRPKKTPLHESLIQVKLEDEFRIGEVQYGLQKMEKSGKLTSVKKNIKNSTIAKFYFPTKLTKMRSIEIIVKKVENYSYWIGRYSDKKITKMIGDHLHSVVKSELKAQGFEIIKEKNIKEYENKKWEKSNHSIDLLAKHKQKNLTIGVEVKNMLYLVPKEEIAIKLDMCKFLGIIPVFACRWLESYRQLIESENGFLWQFKKQIYPFGQEKFVSEIQKRFGYPVTVSNELPLESIKEFEEWIKNYD